MSDYTELRKKLKRRSAPLPGPRPGTSSSAQLDQSTVQRARLDPSRLSAGEVLGLQRRLGNREVQRMLAAPGLSVSGSVSAIQRQGDGEANEDEEKQKEQVDELVLDMEEATPAEGEGPGFELLDDATTPTGDAGNTGMEDLRSAYYRQRQERLNRPPPPKKTAGQEFKSFKNKMKNMVRGNTVQSYGKHGLHAIMHRDEKLIDKAQAALKNDPQKAYTLLRRVTPSVRKSITELNGVSKQVRLALMAPVWFARRQVAHTRWKKLARKVGLVKPADE